MIRIVESSEWIRENARDTALKTVSPESRQHLKVVRPDVGEELWIGDLEGRANLYRVSQTKELRFEFIKQIVERAPERKTHLYLCPPATSALEQSVEQATEVGYDHIHIIRSERTQYSKKQSIPWARLQRIIRASCKQCGRLWSPVLSDKMIDLEEGLSQTQSVLRLVADESSAQRSWGILGEIPHQAKGDVAIFIGPEGGWSPTERDRLNSCSRILSLGPLILRVPTAVVSAYSVAWKDLSNGKGTQTLHRG